MGSGPSAPDDSRAKENAIREERRAKENASREERRAKENAVREERRAKENAARDRSKGASYTGPRKIAKEEAKKFGIDTAGMSTKEINQAVSSAKSVEDDMMKFVERTLERISSGKKSDNAPTDIPPTVTSRVVEDKAQPIPPADNKGGGRPQEAPFTRVKFGCYQDGVAGYFTMLVDGEFKPV